MTARDQAVHTIRLGPDGAAGHLVLIVDVDLAGLDLAGRRLLAAVREAVGAWEATEEAAERLCEASEGAVRQVTETDPQDRLRSTLTPVRGE